MPNIHQVRRVLLRTPTAAASTDADATAWAAAVVTAGGTVSATQLSRVSDLITAYKAASVWTLLDREWLYASENAFCAQVDIKGLASHTLVNNGSLPTFTANEGYAPTGATGYIDAGVAPSGGVNFALNSNTFGCYVRTSRTSGATVTHMGTTTGGADYAYLRALNGSTATEFDDNAADFPTGPANANAQGDYIISRTNSTTIVPYKNGSAGASVTSNASSRSTQNWFVLALNNNGTPINIGADQIASSFLGATMNGTQAAAKALALNNYMTAVGANIY
jgi:hypothetical protein